MRYKQVVVAVVAFLLMPLSHAALAQGPAGDQVIVTFDRPVQVGSQTLPAGDYTIRQVTSAGNPRVLEFTSENGMKVDAAVTAIPILNNTPPTQTKVVLQDEGGGARLSRIWVQGKNYGYEFPGTATAATPPAAASTRLEGTFAPVADRPEAPVIAQAQPSETPSTPPAQAETPAQAPAAAPAPQPEAASPAPAAPAPAAAEVPDTALGWADLMFGGMLVAATGLLFYLRAERKTV